MSIDINERINKINIELDKNIFNKEINKVILNYIQNERKIHFLLEKGKQSISCEYSNKAIVSPELKKFKDSQIKFNDYYYNRAIYLNTFIYIDEYFRKILKVIFSHNPAFIRKKMDKFSYKHSEICNFKTIEDLNFFIKEKELEYIDKYVDNINFTDKVNDLIYFIKCESQRIKKQLNISQEYMNEIDIFRIKRNALVHNDGLISSKYKDDLEKINKERFKNLSIGDCFAYSSKELWHYKSLALTLVDDFNKLLLKTIESDMYGDIHVFSSEKDEFYLPNWIKSNAEVMSKIEESMKKPNFYPDII